MVFSGYFPAPQPSPPPFAEHVNRSAPVQTPASYVHEPCMCHCTLCSVQETFIVFFGAQMSTVIVFGSAFRQVCIEPDRRLRRGKEKSRNLSRDVTMLLCHCELMFPSGVGVSPFRRGTNAAIVQTSCRHRPARGGLLLLPRHREA